MFTNRWKNIYKSQKATKIYCPKATEKIIEHLSNDYIAGQSNAFENWKSSSKIEFIEFENLKDEEKANYLINCALGIENQIMEHCKLNAENINDETIKKYIEKLKEYEI